MLKTCSKCGETKPIEEFRTSKQKLSGYTQPCLICHRLNNSAWRTANPGKMQECRETWAAANPEKIIEKNGRYYQKNKDKINKRNAEWAKANLERRLENRRAWAKKNLPKELKRSRDWKQANPVKARTTLKDWRIRHPEKYIQYGKTRRARVLGCAINDFTEKQWQELKIAYNNNCAYCGIKSDKLQQEHVIPLSRGGNNTLSNIVPSCAWCNGHKKDKTPEEAGMSLIRI